MILFVGINPGVYAVRHGHYFGRRTNRFWPGFSRSRLSAPIRAALGRQVLVLEDDARLLEFGIGFTDVVKLSTRNVSELPPGAFQEWAPGLLERLRVHRPRSQAPTPHNDDHASLTRNRIPGTGGIDTRHHLCYN